LRYHNHFINYDFLNKFNDLYFVGTFTEYEDLKEHVKNLKFYDVVILIDYGHGFINQDIYKTLLKKSKFLAINCQSNSANLGFNLITKYKKSNYICIDEPELRLATSNNQDEIEKIVKDQLNHKIINKNVTITRGRNGCFSYKNSKVLNVPAVISEKVLDTIGAGDVFLVITSLLYSIKTDQLVASLIGNIAGALKVDILGHSKSISQSNFYAVLKHILK